jgi:hypothetical protein
VEVLRFVVMVADAPPDAVNDDGLILQVGRLAG